MLSLITSLAHLCASPSWLGCKYLVGLTGDSNLKTSAPCALPLPRVLRLYWQQQPSWRNMFELRVPHANLVKILQILQEIDDDDERQHVLPESRCQSIPLDVATFSDFVVSFLQ